MFVDDRRYNEGSGTFALNLSESFTKSTITCAILGSATFKVINTC